MSQSDRQDEQRVFPSSIPVRSPSPDIKNRNRILKTISPTIQTKKHVTLSIRQTRGYDTVARNENQDVRTIIHDFEKQFELTDVKRLKDKIMEQDRMISQLTGKSDLKNSRGSEQLKQKLYDKQKTISDLKKVVATLSEKSQISESRSESEKVRALEIENERLGQIVRKLNKKDTHERCIQQARVLQDRIECLSDHNRQLQHKLVTMRQQDNQGHQDLVSLNNTLRQRIDQLLPLDEMNRGLQNQNQRLLRLLTEKRQPQTESSPSQQNQIIRLQSELKILKQKSAPEKLTLLKIREQYNESIRLFKEQVYQQVETEFERTQHIFSDLKIKVGMSETKLQKLMELQKTVFESPVKFAQLSKSHLQETTDLNSEIRRERYERMELQDRFQRLLTTYNNLVNEKQQEGIKYQQNILRSAHDLQILRRQVQVDRQKHHQELRIVKDVHQSQSKRLSSKYKEQVNEFKGSTSNEVSKVVDNYNQEIQVLKMSLISKNSDSQRFQAQLNNKEVEYRRNIQIVEQRIRKQSMQVTRLVGLLAQKELVIRSIKEKKQEVEELGQVRKRSQTELQSRFGDLQLRYTDLLGNYSDISSKYSQVLTRNNQLQQIKRTLQEGNRSLSLENQMIPELKNRIIGLEQQVLCTQEQLQDKKIQYERILSHYNQAYSQKTELAQQIQKAREKLVMIGSMTKTTMEKITQLETRVKSGEEFYQVLQRVSERITVLETENAQLVSSQARQQYNSQSMNQQMLKIKQQSVSLRVQNEQLQNDLAHLTKKLDLKEKQISEMMTLFSSKSVVSSDIFQQSIPVDIDLSDIQRLKDYYQTLANSLSTSMVTIKNTMIEEISQFKAM